MMGIQEITCSGCNYIIEKKTTALEEAIFYNVISSIVVKLNDSSEIVFES